MKNVSLVVLFCLLLSQLATAQFKIPQKPGFQTSVYDYAKLLSATEKAALEQKLIQYSDSTSTQIVVITVETINGESIGILAPRWAQEWGIGQAKEDNGVLILLAAKERDIWISPGYGVEDRLSAGITGELTRNVIIPEFKKGDYYLGLDKGADAIFDVLKGKYKGSRKKEAGGRSPLPFIIIFIIIIVILISRRKGGGGKSGGFGGGGGLAEMIILSSLGRGGFGGFSGGGAGGSW